MVNSSKEMPILIHDVTYNLSVVNKLTNDTRNILDLELATISRQEEQHYPPQ